MSAYRHTKKEKNIGIISENHNSCCIHVFSSIEGIFFSLWYIDKLKNKSNKWDKYPLSFDIYGGDINKVDKK